MPEEKQNKQLIKLVIILVAVLFFAMITTGIVQTFVLKGLNNKQSDLIQKNQQTLEQIQDTEDEIAIRESDDFADASLKKDGYGNKDDIIIKQS